MAGREIEGDLWDQSLGLDRLPMSARVDFRTVSPTSWEQRPMFNKISS